MASRKKPRTAASRPRTSNSGRPAGEKTGKKPAPAKQGRDAKAAENRGVPKDKGKAPARGTKPGRTDIASRDGETEVRANELPRNSSDPGKFPIVGVGASAGGLEALQELFGAMPTDTGVAFVVITHMHRDHVSLLPELLARTTSMPVIEAHDGQTVEADRVYVAPPGDELTIEGGILRRGQPSADFKTPIDSFLRSLARDQRGFAICIVLSGTGSDGTLGLRAIKSEAGMAMVQSPQSAKFAGMPSSAQATGLADFSLSPRDMPEKLVGYVHGIRSRTVAQIEQDRVSIPDEPFRQVLAVLRVRTGNDFSTYKISTIQRRILRRMFVQHIDSPHEYARFLKENKHEAQLLFRDLLITVTNFFRDPGAFDALGECLHEAIMARKGDDAYRVWIPGCATGEEAYSVAIVVREVMQHLERDVDVQIFATDLDPRAIDAARSGVFSSGITSDVSPTRLRKYFTTESEHFRICKEIRDMIIFAPQNVLSDPPFTRLDLIVCRNLLIYFGTEQQQRLLPTFHYALRPNGLLFLGPSETIGRLDELFVIVDRKCKIYRRKEVQNRQLKGLLDLDLLRGRTMTPELAPVRGVRPPPYRALRTEGQVHRFLLSRFAPPCIIVDDNGDVVHIHGRVGLYFEPAQGEPSNNVLKMARQGLATPLASALRKAATQKSAVERRNVTVKSNGDSQTVDIQISPIEEPESFRGLYLISLRPSVERPKKISKPAGESAYDDQSAHLAEVEAELQHAKESLQSTVEELESSNEELKSANEELQSMNEELQSSNEELETSKEEMQSLTEELTTVNTELSSKVEELSHANDDMQNLLNGLEVASIYLDENLCVKRYTEQARELINLMPSDIGRPLSDLAMQIEYPNLIDDCRQVLKNLDRREREIRSSDGKWLMMRILPYRTSQNVIAGVVVTFVAIDRLKHAEISARAAYEFFHDIVETVRAPLLVLDSDLRVRTANDFFYQNFDLTPEMVENRLIYEIADGQWDIPRLRELLEDILPQNSTFNDFVIEHDFARIGRRKIVLNARRLKGESDRGELILLAMESVRNQAK